jgi:hypothetical protein
MVYLLCRIGPKLDQALTQYLLEVFRLEHWVYSVFFLVRFVQLRHDVAEEDIAQDIVLLCPPQQLSNRIEPGFLV